jgi:hypothetical protein
MVVVGVFLSKQSLDQQKTNPILATVAAPKHFQVPNTHGSVVA